jgi:hypothetical protein
MKCPLTRCENQVTLPWRRGPRRQVICSVVSEGVQIWQWHESEFRRPCRCFFREQDLGYTINVDNRPRGVSECGNSVQYFLFVAAASSDSQHTAHTASDSSPGVYTVHCRPATVTLAALAACGHVSPSVIWWPWPGCGSGASGTWDSSK